MNKKPNTEGLRPFKAGAEWKGNAGGRPKKRPITDEYFALANVEIPKQICKALKIKYIPGRTFSQANALARFMDCLKRDGHRSAKEIREATEGKAPQRMEISVAPKTEITVLIKHDRS